MKEKIIYRQLIAFIFLGFFLAQTFSKSFVIADYYTNTSQYAKICENKARPKMHCNGKCQMMKKLKQEEKKDDQAPDRKGENKINILSSKSFFAIVPYNKIDPTKKRYAIFQSKKIIEISFEIFHPPSRFIA